MTEPRTDDAALVHRTLAGERDAFGQLVCRYERILGALCRQRLGHDAEAEDAVQDAFLKAYVALDGLKDPARFGSWLYGIALRTAADRLRRRRTSGRILSLDRVRDEGGIEPRDAAAHALERAAAREQAELVLAALGALPERYRVVLTLRYQKHMAYREIAEHLDEPPGTIANRLHRAVAMLKEQMRAPVAVGDVTDGAGPRDPGAAPPQGAWGEPT